jgi:hypothetical protein
MLWNINNLKPEVRSEFQIKLLNTWRSIYIKSIKVEPIKDLPEMKRQRSIHVAGVEKSPDFHVKEQTSVFANNNPLKAKDKKERIRDMKRHRRKNNPVQHLQRFQHISLKTTGSINSSIFWPS